MTNQEKSEHWWRTSIIDMAPGKINFYGKPIQDLIGNVTFVQMIWLMLRGNTPTEGQAKLLESALVASVDHGPQAPSIATARMAITCGIGLNNAMASAVNMLGDVHGGAGEQCAELYYNIYQKIKEGKKLDNAVDEGLNDFRKQYGKIISGFGHRFHKPVDPRAPRLIQLVEKSAEKNIVSGDFIKIAIAIQKKISLNKKQAITMNIDGATAIIFCELEFEPPLARGLFCLSRSVGILAHAWEQMQQNERNKGPIPKNFLPLYQKND